MNEEKYTELEKKVLQAYTEKTPKSKQMYERACKSFAGGVSGGQGFWQPYPLYLTHGKGSRIYDVGGNEYIDCRCGYGALLLGHAHPELVEAMKRELDRGLLLHNLELGVEAAELLKEIIPCAGLLRYRNTGTEVVMATLAGARAFTGKDKIIKFYGAYHGVASDVIVGWATHTLQASSGGIPRECLANTVVLPWNDIDAVKSKLDEDKEIGTVITETILALGGIFPPKGEYLAELRQLTKERGVILIFDEVITGWRLALGGAQEYFGVTPDMACYAKATAGGTPFAAVAGREDVMSVFSGGTSGTFTFGGDSKVVFQSGTMNDNTAGTAATIASIKVLKRLKEQGEYEKLNERTSKCAREIEAIFRRKGMGCYVNTIGSYFKLHFTDVEPTFDVVCSIDKRKIYLFTLALMSEGVLLCPPSSGSSFLSFAHTDEDVARILDAVNSTLGKFRFDEIL